jgi:addiction module antidote protein HigA
MLKLLVIKIIIRGNMMRMFNPPHPAEVLKEDILPELGLTVTEAAKQLGVNRVTLSRLLNGKMGISADMALRLHQWLGENSPSAESWLYQQANYDLWKASRSAHFNIIPICA